VSQGTAKRLRIGKAPKPKARFAPLAPNGNGVQQEGNLTALPLNKFLGIDLG
jgi:hypothetical protein